MGKSRTLSDKEMKRLMDHLKARCGGWKAEQGRRDMVVFQLLLCGMRIGEVASLKQKEVIKSLDPEVQFNESFCLKAKNTKTKQGRWVYLTKTAKLWLGEYIKFAQKDKYSKYQIDPSGDAALIQSQKSRGKCMSANSLRQAVNKHFDACDIPSSSHFGRKQVASLLMEQGVSVYHIQKVLGHGDLRTTSRYIEDLKAETKLDKVLGDLSF